jgi:hypothetical protein
MGRSIPREAFPFVGPTDLAISPYIDSQRSINLYYDPAYKGSVEALVGTPGLSTPLVTLAHTPTRALYAGNNRLFAIGGVHFYELNPTNGAVIHDFMGITGTDVANASYQCQMQGNGTQFLVCDPAPLSQQIYLVDIGGTNTLVSQINAYALEYLDGFFISLTAGASLAGTNPNQLNVSAFGNGASWPGLAFAVQEGTADAIVTLAVVNNLLWVFSQKNITVYYNAGLNNFPFARVNSGTLNVGCAAQFSVVKVANSVMWLGSSDRGWGQVYLANGLLPVKVSTPAVENIINKGLSGGAGNTAQSNYLITAFAYEEAGHTFYVLNLPGLAYSGINGGTGGATLVYDLTTKLWHERSFYNAGTPQLALPWVFCSIEQSPTNSFTTNFVGDRAGANGNGGTPGAIYRYGQFYTADNASAIQRYRTCSHIRQNYDWEKYSRFEVFADIGTAQMSLIYSKNGGKTFPTPLRPDATISGSNDQGGSPTFGTYKRFKWDQLGRARIFTPGITILDSSNSIAIAGADLKAGEGAEE